MTFALWFAFAFIAGMMLGRYLSLRELEEE